MPSNSEDKSLAIIPQDLPIENYDYDGVDPEKRVRIVFLNQEIEDALTAHGKSLFDIGDKLIEMKGLLGNKRFSTYLRKKYGMEIRSAQTAMQTARVFPESTQRVALFGKVGVRSLQMLSAKDVPDEARKEVIDIASSGKRVGIKKTKQIIDESKGIPAPEAPPAVRRTCKVCGDQLPSERGFICSGCMNAGAGATGKPHTVQPNMPRTDRDDAEPGRSSVGRTFTPAADGNISRGVFGREVKEYILGKIKLCKQAGTGIHEALDAWEEELRG